MGKIQVTQNEIFGEYVIIAKTLLQRVYREENRLFGFVDTYLPEKEKKEVSIKIGENLSLLERNFMRLFLKTPSSFSYQIRFDFEVHALENS